MKRHGQLMEAIAAPENLRLAFWKAAKGKRGKADCQEYREDLDANVAVLRQELLDESVAVGGYHYFTIHDPKERIICAAKFKTRVLHHALMNLCEPVFERAAVFDSYACRKGKGQLAAVTRAQEFARQHGWFLKMDIRKYFDSVNHQVLNNLLERKFKDDALLGLFRRIIGSYETAPGQGLPIGNLTSQHFANDYLAPLDRFLKEHLRRRAYVRYMDDFVVWGASGAELRAVWQAVDAFLQTELKLQLKNNVTLNRTAHGMDFLGYRLRPHKLRLARRSKLRFHRKFHRYEQALADGQWDEQYAQRRMQALVAFTLPAQCWDFRQQVMKRFGVVAFRLEPGVTGRQLEQQHEELPGGEPQQQQPEQQEQQHRIPLCPSLSSTVAPNGVATDPDAIPSTVSILPWQIRREHPPGASRLAEPSENSGRPFYMVY